MAVALLYRVRLFQRHRQRNPGFLADVANDVPMAGEVLGDQNVAGAELALGAAGNLDLSAAGQKHHVLVPGRGVIVLPPPRRALPDRKVAGADIVGDVGKLVGVRSSKWDSPSSPA